MKIWFVASAVLSGLSLTVFLVSMESCDHAYEIDAQGRLVQAAGTREGSPSPKGNSQVYSWESRLPEFAGLAARVRPGDRLVHTETTAGFPHVMTLSMSTLEVFRGEDRVIRAWHGGVPFWGAIVGISSLPLVCWTLAAIGLSLAPARLRGRGPG